jgi:aerobic-type carbon monoxide dehydrogenase small subunit (CoxS/CutS family)
MPDVSITVNGVEVSVKQGTTVAAAILIAGETAFRRSVSGEPRGPLCGMGVCYECRVSIDGEAHARSCQIPCRARMNVVAL